MGHPAWISKGVKENPKGTWLWNPTPSIPLRAGSNVEKHDVRMGHPLLLFSSQTLRAPHH